MKNKLTLAYEKSGEVVTSSLVVAKLIDRPHYLITRLIERHMEDFLDFGLIDFQSQLVEQRSTKIFLLNESQFVLLIGYLRATRNKSKVNEAKKQVVKYINFLKTALKRKQTAEFKQLKIEHSDTFKPMCAALDMDYKKTHPDAEKAPAYVYSNEANLHAKLATGKTATKWRADLKLKKHENFYSYLPKDQFENLVFLNQATLGLVLAEKNYSERKKIFEDSIKRLVEMKKSKTRISCGK